MLPIRLWSIGLTATLQLAALRGCTALEAWDWQSQAIANPTPQAQCERWGDGRGLTSEQAIAAQHLSWPQTYGAVIDRLGYPDCRSAGWDLYKTPTGSITVHYSGAIAITITITDIP